VLHGLYLSLKISLRLSRQDWKFQGGVQQSPCSLRVLAPSEETHPGGPAEAACTGWGWVGSHHQKHREITDGAQGVRTLKICAGTGGCRVTRRRPRSVLPMWGTWCYLQIFCTCSLPRHGPFQSCTRERDGSFRTQSSFKDLTGWTSTKHGNPSSSLCKLAETTTGRGLGSSEEVWEGWTNVGVTHRCMEAMLGTSVWLSLSQTSKNAVFLLIS
jgi:hypothetical protein